MKMLLIDIWRNTRLGAAKRSAADRDDERVVKKTRSNTNRRLDSKKVGERNVKK